MALNVVFDRELIPHPVAEALDQIIATMQTAFNKKAESDTETTGSLRAGLVPAGFYGPYGGDSAPAGWLLCDGTLYQTGQYPDLFAAIAYKFGGSGNYFNVPDMRQRFPLGKASSGTGDTIGDTGGAIDMTLSVPALTVDPPDTNLSFTAVTVDANLDGTTVGAVKTISVVPHTDIAQFNTGTGTTGSGNPPYLVGNYIIKT
jgi:microcystin-dependent protein